LLIDPLSDLSIDPLSDLSIDPLSDLSRCVMLLFLYKLMDILEIQELERPKYLKTFTQIMLEEFVNIASPRFLRKHNSLRILLTNRLQ